MKTLTLNFKDGFDEYDDSIIFVSIDGYKKSPLFYYIDTVGFDRTPLIFSDKISNLFTKIFLNFENCITTVKNNDKFQLNSLGLNNCSYAICTYHPVTMEKSNVQKVVYEFLDAIEQFPEIQFIVTKSNADQGGNEINAILEKNEKKIKNLHVFSSLGVKRYLSLMKNCEFVLGNSSSGIIEAPAFKVPTVNIGNRQRGRLQSKSIINCEEEASSIVLAIKTALSVEFRMVCAKVESPYGKGDSAEKISRKIYDIILNKEIDLRKKFYNSGEKK